VVLKMAYFDKTRLCRVDAVNDAIWLHSATAQTSIQHPNDLVGAESIGAQQAMMCAGIAPRILSGSILPWVPDLLGECWKSEDAVLVVGTAYAGFIREFSGRPCCMGLTDYAGLAQNSWPDFHDSFIDQVVAKDSDYYGPVSTLVGGVVDFAHLALLDLCRASFVKRGRGSTNRIDNSSQANVKAEPERFSDYVEWSGLLPNGRPFGPGEWTWSRITGSCASCIVVLGHVAEHGLLRQFRSRLPDSAIWLRTRRDTEPSINLNSKKWANAYANRWQKLDSWVPATDLFRPEDVEWWCVTGTVNGTVRRWSVLPMYHPANAPDAAYCRRANARLKVMWESRED